MPEQKKSLIKFNRKKVSELFRIDKKQQTTLVLLLTIILTLAFGYLLTLPIQSSYAANQLNYKNLELQKSSLQANQDILIKLAKEKETRAEFLSRVTDAMPNSPQIPEILVTLEKMAADNNLVIANFTPKATDETRVSPAVNYKSMTLNFDISGSYPDMKNFLKDLENNIRPINILTISITGGGEITQASTQLLRFSIKALVYYKELN